MAKTRNTAALHFTPSPVLLGVLRAHARLLAGGGPAQVGHVVEGLARGALAPLAADLWQEADRLALCRQREGVAPAAIALEVETLLVGRLAGQAVEAIRIPPEAIEVFGEIREKAKDRASLRGPRAAPAQPPSPIVHYPKDMTIAPGTDPVSAKAER